MLSTQSLLSHPVAEAVLPVAHELMSSVSDSLGLQHLAVMQPSKGQGPPDKDDDDDGPDDDQKESMGGKGMGKGKGKGKGLKKCDDGMMETDPMCWYEYSDWLSQPEQNEKEWWIALMMSWDNMAWLGIFGPFIIWQSMWSIFEVLFWEDESDLTVKEKVANWKALDDMTKMYATWVGFVASMGQPTFFFLSQFLTGFESNLADASLLYMSPSEMCLYFIYNTIWTLFKYPFAAMWVTVFSPIYFIQVIIWCFEMLVETPDEGKGGKGGKGGRGGKGGMDGDKGGKGSKGGEGPPDKDEMQ